MSSNKVLIISLVGASLLAYYVFIRRRDRQAPSQKNQNDQNYDDLLPPLPNEVVQLLQISKLCFLATINESEPHLSLMNFTYYQPDEVMIVCTRRNTKKYEHIKACPNVSVLVHDFPHLTSNATSEQHSKQWSITLNGKATCLNDSDELSIKYRYANYTCCILLTQPSLCLHIYDLLSTYKQSKLYYTVLEKYI